MKYILGTVIAILCSFTCTDTLYGKSPATDVDDILIINTYTEANPWSNDFITSIVNMASQNSHIGVYTAHMKMLTLDEENKLKTFKESLFKSYKNPKLIVLIGCGSFIMCDELNRQWPDIPMILCGERDYTGPKETMIREHALPRTERIPISDLQKKYNLTLMQSSVYLNENLQLMKQLIPKMDKVMYIGDETYICQQNDYDLSEIIREKYPELDYQFLSAKDIRTDSLFNILNHVNPHTTGVIFSSWLYKSSPHDNIMRSNSHRVISTAPIPLFSLRAIGIEEEGGIVGGYIYNKEKYNARLLETIHKILDGTPARNIPLYYPDDGAPVFNYKSLLQRDLNPKLCPKGTIFYNMPPTFWEKYEYVIISITAAIITLLFFFQYLRLQSLSRIKRLQQQQLDSNLKYRNLINNMPILYMYEKLIKDEKGRITDTLYIDVNNFFEDRFIMRKEAVGKRGSELFPESMNEFLHFMNIALKEKRSVTFPYYYKKIDTFYDIVVKASDNGEYMHVFCVDSTELHHTQIQLRSTNRKLSMALDVANIVPWKWNLRTHTILCDVNKPIELSNNAGIMDDEQLSVPDSQYFSKIQKQKQIIDDYKYEIGIAKERGIEPNIKIEESGIQQENGHKQVNTRIDYSNKPQDKYNIEALSNKEVIGTISYYDFNGKVCEVIEYNTVESYLKSIKDELNSNPNGFKYETLTTDANIRKSVDDIVYGAYGEDNPHPLEWYSSNNTKAAISPEQYLSEERNKIMREYAKNPFGALNKENISAEGMDKWAAVTNKYMEMKTNISTKQIELQSSGCKTLIYDVSHSSGQEEIGNYRILDKSTGKTESINVGDIDLEKQSPETLKKLLSGQQTEMTNKSGTNSLVTLNKTITGWGISAVKQVFNSADNSAGI